MIHLPAWIVSSKSWFLPLLDTQTCDLEGTGDEIARSCTFLCVSMPSIHPCLPKTESIALRMPCSRLNDAIRMANTPARLIFGKLPCANASRPFPVRSEFAGWAVLKIWPENLVWLLFHLPRYLCNRLIYYEYIFSIIKVVPIIAPICQQSAT